MNGVARADAGEGAGAAAAGAPPVEITFHGAANTVTGSCVHLRLPGGTLIVAGSVNSAAQIRDLATAGADAFTVGSAVLDGSFAPTKGALASQIADILAACA